jgi:hypothetical protein
MADYPWTFHYKVDMPLKSEFLQNFSQVQPKLRTKITDSDGGSVKPWSWSHNIIMYRLLWIQSTLLIQSPFILLKEHKWSVQEKFCQTHWQNKWYNTIFVHHRIPQSFMYLQYSETSNVSVYNRPSLGQSCIYDRKLDSVNHV